MTFPEYWKLAKRRNPLLKQGDQERVAVTVEKIHDLLEQAYLHGYEHGHARSTREEAARSPSLFERLFGD